MSCALSVKTKPAKFSCDWTPGPLQVDYLCRKISLSIVQGDSHLTVTVPLITLTIEAGAKNTLKCSDAASPIIAISSAKFAARPEKKTADEIQRFCIAEKDMTSSVKTRCEGLSSCELSVKAKPTGASVCVWTPRPLTIAYSCVAGTVRTTTTTGTTTTRKFNKQRGVVRIELLD
ncbi:hypothetical protein BV898_06001 [Hypsibius exemplaris]|uniref:SUEL-type lectin domain-containing protein n=1 Tax=Hypsibius exemplaris TaxID=2072580 RepID=A0A1W0WXR1_HYPEX|nr:hypothetical protein BV898_06001 [Hypsibius exemplaris]